MKQALKQLKKFNNRGNAAGSNFLWIVTFMLALLSPMAMAQVAPHSIYYISDAIASDLDMLRSDHVAMNSLSRLQTSDACDLLQDLESRIERLDGAYHDVKMAQLFTAANIRQLTLLLSEAGFCSATYQATRRINQEIGIYRGRALTERMVLIDIRRARETAFQDRARIHNFKPQCPTTPIPPTSTTMP